MVIIERSPEFPATDAIARGAVMTRHIQGDAANQGQVLGRVIVARSTGIFTKLYLQNPVWLVFDAPVTAHGRREPFLIRERTEEILKRQHRVSPTLDNRSRDGFLATHRIGGPYGPLQVEQCQEVWNGSDLVGLLGDRLLRQYPARPFGQRTDPMHGRVHTAPTPAHGFAIHPHLLVDQARRPPSPRR